MKTLITCFKDLHAVLIEEDSSKPLKEVSKMAKTKIQELTVQEMEKLRELATNKESIVNISSEAIADLDARMDAILTDASKSYLAFLKH